jgi:glyoxylase-like metal-dependent hydrolase (beta-lactamase superfamily II)
MLINNPPVEITPTLWMLGTSAYPLFLVKGPKEGALVEGGTGAMGPVLREQLQRLGIGPDYVKQVIVTHAHPDHVMAVPLFRQMFPGVSVVASAAAAKTLAAEKAISFFCQMDDALTGSLLKAGLISDAHRPQPLAEKQIAVDRVVKEGDAIAVDGISLQVLETPGHSECSLSFYEPGQKILVISDATGYYMPERDAWWPNYFGDYRAYVNSMKRLAGLEAEVLCLSHNGVIRGGEEIRVYFRKAVSATEAYHQRIVAEAKAGKTLRQIAEQLGAEVHQNTQLLPLDFFQKSCGLLVKQSLKSEGIHLEK